MTMDCWGELARGLSLPLFVLAVLGWMWLIRRTTR